MKIRSGFVSNSSSSSFIVINNELDEGYIRGLRKNFCNEDDSTFIVDDTIGESRFGWGYEVYKDLGTKVIFSYIQARYLELKNDSRGTEWIKMLEDVIKDVMGVKTIVWKIVTDLDNNEWVSNYSYIDHQSASYEGSNVEMFGSKETLKNFLFSTKSFIETGNDNN